LLTAAVVAGTASLGYLLPPGFQPTYHLYFVKVATCFYALVGLVAAEPAWRALASAVRSRPFAPAAVSVVVVLSSWALYWPVAVAPDAHDPTVLAARDLIGDLDASLSPHGEYELLSRGGIDASLVAETLAAHLDDGSRSVRLFQEGGSAPRSGRLIVTQAGSDTALAGTVIASEGAPRSGDAAAVARQLSAWLRRHPPLRLDPAIPRVLANYVDGSAPSLCLQDLARRPQDLLDLPPPVVAELLAEQGIAQPPGEPDVDVLVRRWRSLRPTSVRRYPRRVVPPNPRRNSQNMGLLVSRSSC